VSEVALHIFPFWTPHFLISGGASPVKEPGPFEVKKFSSQDTRCTFFLKKVDDLFSSRPQNTVGSSK